MSPSPISRRVAYVANADSHDISVLDCGAATAGDDALAEVERFAVGGTVMPLAVSPDRRVLYASIRSAPFRVVSLAIDAASGRLREIGSAPLPESSCWISTDPGGRFLLSASYGASRIAVSPIGDDGVAGPAQQIVATEANAHSIRIDPARRFALAACLGGGVMRQMRFDDASGQLTPNEPAAWHARPGAGPRHFVFHPTLAIVYLLNELDATLDTLAYDPERGTLSATQAPVSVLPAGFADGAPWAADVHLTPDARFLYASERRSSTLAAFAVDPATGALAPIGSIPTEAEPRTFAITADGATLLVAGQASHRLSRYAIDGARGTLVKKSEQGVGRNPNWIEIVDLPA